LLRGAADAGDVIAQEILIQAAQDLASLVADVADRLHLRESEFLLAKIGGHYRALALFSTRKSMPH